MSTELTSPYVSHSMGYGESSIELIRSPPFGDFSTISFSVSPNTPVLATRKVMKDLISIASYLEKNLS